jgi:hypothetical protein
MVSHFFHAWFMLRFHVLIRMVRLGLDNCLFRDLIERAASHLEADL